MTGDGSSDDRFSVLVDRHYDDVYAALAMTLNDPRLAEDCTQTAFLRAYERIDRIDPRRNPSGWLYRTGLNEARSWWRRLRRELLRAQPAQQPDRPSGQPARELDPQLDAAIRELPVGQRAVIVLRFLLDWPVADVAAALDVAEGTVRSRQHRALERLRSSVQEGVEHGS